MPYTPSYITSNLPNLASLPRDAIYILNGVNAPVIFDTVATGQAPSFIGLDFVIQNAGSTPATYLIDGIQFSIDAGTTETAENLFFTNFQLTSGSNVKLRIYGIRVNTLIGLVGVNPWAGK